jgi:hypothetical protein
VGLTPAQRKGGAGGGRTWGRKGLAEEAVAVLVENIGSGTIRPAREVVYLRVTGLLLEDSGRPKKADQAYWSKTLTTVTQPAPGQS